MWERRKGKGRRDEAGNVRTTPRDLSPKKAVPGSPEVEALLRSLPRPGKLNVEGELKVQRRRAVILAEASWYRVLARAFLWFLNLLRMLFRSVVDRIKGRTEPKYFGIRLRKLFEEMGGTAIKVGQQLSVRVDLFPLEVCHELAALRDKVPPFPSEQAVAIIEQAIGARRGGGRASLSEVFQAFDPSPIGSASIACVYQGVLLTGERVAIKVRRPSVIDSFGADLGVMDIATTILERLAFVREGFFKNLRSELRSMLVQELDFAQEARFQRLFRHYTKKDKLRWLSAPKIYTDYCSQEVMVSEFVEGVWCDEIVKAFEVGDQVALGKLEEMGITPKKLGLRLMQYNLWSRFEALFFHSDPHPGNILVQRGCKIIFVDFGSCGTMSRKSRLAQLMMVERLSYNDISGTVDAAVATLEPLPFIDVYELKKEVEAHFWDWLFAFRDKKAEWWERTTAGIWFALLDITRQKKIPVGLETLRLARSLMLIDTLCFELYPKLSTPVEFRRYMRKAARRGARRVIRRAQRTPISEYFDTVIWQTDEVVNRGRFLAWQAERAIDAIPNEFAVGISKGMYILQEALKLGAVVGLVAGVLAIYKKFYLNDADLTLGDITGLFFNPFVMVFFTIPVWIVARRIWHRLTDLDVPRSRTTRDG